MFGFSLNKYIVGTVLIIILGSIGGFLAWKDLTKQFASNNSRLSTSTDETLTASTTGEGDYEIIPIPDEPPPETPFPIEIKANLNADSRMTALENIRALTEAIKKNPTIHGYWLDYGLQMNFIGQYDKARQAWEYASYLRPNDYIPYHNLGDLYTFSFNDYAKAEANYREALRREPASIIVYQKMYELYRFRVKDNAKAKAILEEGIAKNPTTGEWLEKLLAEFEASI